MKGLKGKRVGVAADRKSEAICTLLKKRGAEAVAYPSQGKQQLNQEVSLRNVRDFLDLDFDWAILTTGIGAKTLENAANDAQWKHSLIQKLGHISLAIRGSKTVNWLHQHELHPKLLSGDGTMETLIQSIPPTKTGARVFLQAYHQDDALWKERIERLGYEVYLSQPYSFEPPEESVMDQLRSKIISRSLDAVVFTSKTQVINLCRDGSRDMVDSFNDRVVAVAVGKVTAQQLRDEGIQFVVEPAIQKMGAMVVELDRYYQNQKVEV